MQKILVAHGPNLNLLGQREPAIYGNVSLREINENLKSLGKSQDFYIETKQTNAEHEFVEFIHTAYRDGVAFLLLNPAAFTHTSIAIRDALLAVKIPFIEIHISNIHARESFRNASYLSDIAEGVIAGLGPMGYELALAAAISRLTNTTTSHE